MSASTQTVDPSKEALVAMKKVQNPFDPELPAPSNEESEAIIALVDPAERNLRITQTYHELAVALAEQLGKINVTWRVCDAGIKDGRRFHSWGEY